MLTVACVLKSGGVYTDEHVERLERQVKAHLHIEYNFVCLSDGGGKPLTKNWPGWWSKLELFKPGQFWGRVLYFDLDVTIIDDLTPVYDIDAPFVECREFQEGGDNLNSSVMLWTAGVGDRIFEQFKPGYMNTYNGDQNWITEQMLGAVVFPHPIISSYKRSFKTFKTPGTRVVVFHGEPKPWDVEGFE